MNLKDKIRIAQFYFEFTIKRLYKKMNITLPIEAKEIQKLIPHRYPFMLIDRITEFESGKTLTALKNVSINEPQFTGHFPEFP